ncbi:hypothetical protein NE237_028714 [Protea cynaroides]|uniref:Uncharacterized protein n=1 Tax=Protea cynaroides TaxID=273540 RepID=A0A9Q0GTU0_9MAGN|nr:hypothetical protein NE237_028714 [Protea cynaroides]
MQRLRCSSIIYRSGDPRERRHGEEQRSERRRVITMPPNGLHAAFVLSKKPHARIFSIDDSEASLHLDSKAEGIAEKYGTKEDYQPDFISVVTGDGVWSRELLRFPDVEHFNMVKQQSSGTSYDYCNRFRWRIGKGNQRGKREWEFNVSSFEGRRRGEGCITWVAKSKKRNWVIRSKVVVSLSIKVIWSLQLICVTLVIIVLLLKDCS